MSGLIIFTLAFLLDFYAFVAFLLECRFNYLRDGIRIGWDQNIEVLHQVLLQDLTLCVCVLIEFSIMAYSRWRKFLMVPTVCSLFLLLVPYLTLFLFAKSFLNF